MVSTSDETLTRQWVYESQVRADQMARQVKSKGEEQRKKRAQQRPQPKHTEIQQPHVLGPGDTVYVQSLGAEGDIISKPDNSGQVEVQVGAFKMRVPVTGVTLRSAAGTRQEVSASSNAARYAPSAPAVAPPLEYDFRGWRAEEVIEEIDRRLNEAAMVGMPFLRIIHGKGTGALRKALRDFLGKHPLVKGLETPRPEEGGEGVTIVRL